MSKRRTRIIDIGTSLFLYDCEKDKFEYFYIVKIDENQIYLGNMYKQLEPMTVEMFNLFINNGNIMFKQNEGDHIRRFKWIEEVSPGVYLNHSAFFLMNKDDEFYYET